MKTALYKLDFYKYKKIGNHIDRLDNTFSVYVVAYSRDEAVRCLQAEGLKEGHIIEVFQHQEIHAIDLYSSQIVNNIIRDCGKVHLDNLKRQEEVVNATLEKGLHKQSWKNASL
jgi:hypothetical protein